LEDVLGNSVLLLGEHFAGHLGESVEVVTAENDFIGGKFLLDVELQPRFEDFLGKFCGTDVK